MTKITEDLNDTLTYLYGARQDHIAEVAFTDPQGRACIGQVWAKGKADWDYTVVLIRPDETITAYDCRTEENAVRTLLASTSSAQRTAERLGVA